MKKQLLLFCSLVFLFTSLNASQRDLNLKLRSGDVQVQELNDQLTIGEAINSLNHDNDYYIVQFDQIPTELQKNNLRSKGIDLLEYLPEFAFVANLKGLNSSEKIGELNIRGIVAFENRFKFPDYFDLQTAPDYVTVTSTKVRLLVDRQLNYSSAELANFLESNAIEIEEVGIMAENFKIIIERNRIDWLADQAIVKFLDYAPAPPEAEDTRARSLHGSNLLDSDHPMGRDYTGDGVSMAIADNGLGPHIDRKGRVTMHTTVNNGTHGDMTTGIAVGAGNLDPRYRGHATESYLHYYNISGYPHIAQALTNYAARGVVITSTSFSQGCNAGYTTDTRSADLQVRSNDHLIHVFSAGNSASSTCGGNAYGAGTPWGTITGGIKQGKNVIAVGNLDYRGTLTNSSSRGPARDGRIKPDICANGTNQISTDPNNGYSPGGGTSAAAPSVAGVAAQIYEGYRDLNNNQDPPTGLIKAAMLNTARDLGNVGPDYFFGWGRVNGNKAMKLLEDNRYINSTIAQNTQNTHSITLPNAVEELKVMVYWTDAAGAAFSSKALVNDLNLRVVTPLNDTLLPWVLNTAPVASFLAAPATRGVDNLNNVEQVAIDTARAGTYTVLIDGFAVPSGPQSYHLVWETATDSIAVTYPNGGEGFVPGETETIRWDAFGNSGIFTIQYSTNNGATWTNAGTTSGTIRYLNWNVPNVVSGDVLVRVNRGGSVSGVSENTFSIIRQPNGIGIDFVCPDSVQVRWSPVSGATEYEVYLLGPEFMDSVGTTTNTNFRFYNLNLADDNWWAVKAKGNGIEGRRTLARLLPKVTTNCPIDFDFEVVSITEPSSGFVQSCITTKMPVRIAVKNDGDSILRNVPLRLIAGNTVIRDTIAGPLLPRASSSFSFRDSIPVSTAGILNISVVNDLPTDQNETNDSVGTSVQVLGGTPFTLPYTNDFENFNFCSTASDCGTTNCILNGGWVNVANTSDDFDMRTNSGSTPSSNTGPTVDRNPGTGAGKYIYSEASNGCTGLTSQVLTPCFDLSGTFAPEFSFWYHMNGATMGSLAVDIMTANGWVFNAMPILNGNLGTQWRRQAIDLTNYAGQTISLRFRVTTGSSWTSDLAIDDVRLIDLSTDLGEVIKTDEYKLFPNPTEGYFNIQLTEGQIGDVRVFDLQGRNVFNSFISSQNAELDLSGLDNGIYIIEFNEGRREKIIIQ